MIEMFMFFAMGFLAAALSVLVVVPLVHRRAVRLTRRRLEGTIPTSMAEILAYRDLLRAEFAMSTRRLEVELEQTKAQRAGERAELDRKSDAIKRLNIELDALRCQFGAKEESAVEPNTTVAERHKGGGVPQATEAQNETVALQAQVRALTEWLAQAGAEIRAVNAEYIEHETTNQRLLEERDRFDTFHRRVAELVGQLVRRSAEEKALRHRDHELEIRLAHQLRLLLQRESELARLKGELEIALMAEADLRHTTIEIDGRANAAAAENRKLQASLDRANGERARLAFELSEFKRPAAQMNTPPSSIAPNAEHQDLSTALLSESAA
jgi:chromosome segregation ATPase